ncbi:Fur family transcriptional regulator [Clostridium senegalense]|uniref:Fur family transcriptional regulator n=1 Tax=Clostridium senegalense TaxID=1465809 RepID=UPI001C11AD7E|nr:Fur family transcriptional regulator [Clostridium senegalense]MBU5226135.1 transcriptional repressor [Clostridium senegalense]
MLDVCKNLKEKNLKVTKARVSILELLFKSDKCLSANEIWENIRKTLIGIDLSTVYRNLDVLVNKNIIEKDILDNNIYVYSIQEDIHMHTIICERCNKAFEIECPMPKLREYIRLKTGVIITDQCIDVKNGICKECNKISEK